MTVGGANGHGRGVVYLLDDDASFVRSTARLLESCGISAEGFTSPAAFLAHEVPDVPACLVLDLRMPGMSGLEVQSAVSARPRKLPVVFLSGHSDLRSAIEALKAGAVDFLSKPVDEGALLGAVEAALRLDARNVTLWQSARAGRARLARLSALEREVCRLVVTGLRDDEIAAAIGSAEDAVRAARAKAMEQLSATSLVHLARVVEAASAE